MKVCFAVELVVLLTNVFTVKAAIPAPREFQMSVAGVAVKARPSLKALCQLKQEQWSLSSRDVGGRDLADYAWEVTLEDEYPKILAAFDDSSVNKTNNIVFLYNYNKDRVGVVRDVRILRKRERRQLVTKGKLDEGVSMRLVRCLVH
jgi:hypothetical protein